MTLCHLTPANYRVMPWANGRGTTTELARADEGGALLWRLSMATVAENGDFSVLPGVDRNLTVIEGPGFELTGDRMLRADPMRPVAFPGDVAIAAAGVTGTAIDFNVMTARGKRVARVQVASGDHRCQGDPLAIFALEPQTIALNGTAHAAGRHDLLIARGEWDVNGSGRMILVEILPA